MKVVLSKKSEKFVLELDQKRYGSILSILKHLETNPIPYKQYDLKKLTDIRNGYRIRKGKIRILYTIEKELNLIFVEKIESRDETTYK